MNKPDISAQTSDCHSLVLANQSAGTLVRLGHDSSPTIYLQHAVQILSEHDLALPEPDELNLIVRSALAVQSHYFAACLHHPDHTELYEVFEAFLLACVTSSQETEIPCPTLQ